MHLVRKGKPSRDETILFLFRRTITLVSDNNKLAVVLRKETSAAIKPTTLMNNAKLASRRRISSGDGWSFRELHC
jgi:hypothetical protein